MSKVEMLCWAILAMQATLVLIGLYISDRVGQILHIARKSENDTLVLYEDTDAHAHFKSSLVELEEVQDRKFGPPIGPDYHDKPPGI